MKNLHIIFVTILWCIPELIFPQVPIVQVEMRNTFGVHLNTFDNTFIPDGRHFEIQTLKIFFTEEEQKKIFYLADSLNFWGLPDTLKSADDDRYIVLISDCPCPCSTRIKTNQKDKTVTAGCYIANKLYRERLRELEFEILRIVEQKPEYKTLERRKFQHGPDIRFLRN